MKKITLFICAVLFTVTSIAQVSITKNWERSDSLGTRHIWNTGDNTRGMAYGTMNGNERMFLTTRSTTGGQTARVVILNAATGDSISVMNMTGVAGGTHVISDAGLTEDGVLFVSNLTTAVSATSPLKIYKWINETTAPTIAVQWGDATTTGRYGDKITVTGKVSDGTARIYAVQNVSGTAAVKYWDMTPDTNNPGSYIFNQTPKDFYSVANLGVIGGIGFRPDGAYYFKINGANMISYSSVGVKLSESSSAVIASSGNNARYIGDDNQGSAVVCMLRYSTGASTYSVLGNQKISFFRAPLNNLANAVYVTETPSLGKTANGNGAGSITVKKLLNNNVEVYVLSTNNGVAKYTISGLLTGITTSINSTTESLKITKTSSLLKVEGATPVAIELFNTLGQKVQSVVNKNELNISNLRGVHIVKVNVNGKVSTQKVSI